MRPHLSLGEAAGMRFGVAIFATGDGMDVADVGRDTAERGLESLFLPEHAHIPTSRRGPRRSGAQVAARARRLVAADTAGVPLGCAPDTVLGGAHQTVRSLLDAGEFDVPQMRAILRRGVVWAAADRT
jgi:hypothetical protein